MSLQDTVNDAVRGFVDKVRRDAIAYSICAVCSLAVLVLATGAAVMALIPVVGAVYAQLVVASVFVLAIVLTMFRLQRPPARQQPAQAVPLGAAADAAAVQRQAQFAQIAMIIEAVLLGYSMSRKR